MKKLSLQWRITLMTFLLLTVACVTMKTLLCSSGHAHMDSIGSYVLHYADEEPQSIRIDMPEEQWKDVSQRFAGEFVVELTGVKHSFCMTGWYIALAVTVMGGAVAYFVSGRARKNPSAACFSLSPMICPLYSTAASTTPTAAGSVYYLNFKPEADEQWQELAEKYTDETGVPVTVLTAASGEYEKTLKSEMAKTDAPTLFQVNGPVGLASWKDYCYDLKDADITKELTSDAYELKDGDAVDGIAYVIESYGLITNKTLLEKAGYTLDDIKSFDDLKKVAEDITARKDELGFSAFTSAGMDGSSDWRFKTHLANLPIYYE